MHVVLPAGHRGRLDVLLCAALEQSLEEQEVSRSALIRWIRAGHVRSGSGVLDRPGVRVEGPLELTVRIPAPAPSGLAPDPSVPFRILYEDADLAVVDKPAGVVVHPGAGAGAQTLVHGLLHRLSGLSGVGGVERPGIVHRIDKDTSGLLVVAKNDETHRALSAQFKARSVDKEYLAWVHGLVAASGEVNAAIARDPRNRKRMSIQPGGRAALTRIEPVRAGRAASLVRVRPATGRTHQIRVHLASLHHPILNDALYGARLQRLPAGTPHLQEHLRAHRRFFLHACRLAFDHPRNGERLCFEAPPPPEFTQIAELEWN